MLFFFFVKTMLNQLGNFNNRIQTKKATQSSRF